MGGYSPSGDEAGERSELCEDLEGQAVDIAETIGGSVNQTLKTCNCRALDGACRAATTSLRPVGKSDNYEDRLEVLGEIFKRCNRGFAGCCYVHAKHLGPAPGLKIKTLKEDRLKHRLFVIN